MKTKRRSIISIGLLLAGGIIFIASVAFFSKTNLPLEDEAEYTSKVNEWILKTKNLGRPNNTDLAAQQEEFLERAVSASDKAVQDIHFHGKVVDQHEQPVSEMEVVFDAGSAPFSKGTGTGFTSTDANGKFVISGAKGNRLSIRDLKKEGYEFRFSRSGEGNFVNTRNTSDDQLWINHDGKNPYIFRVWKIEHSGRLKTGNHVFGFFPDGSITTLDLLSSKMIFKSGLQDGDITISFFRSDDDWRVEISAINGGLQEYTDVYAYVAPENGYRNELIFESTKSDNEELRKNVYFRSRNGQVYGRIEMDIRPYYRDKPAIVLQYTINIDGARYLTKRK